MDVPIEAELIKTAARARLAAPSLYHLQFVADRNMRIKKKILPQSEIFQQHP